MYNYPNRSVCSVLDEMRACYKTRNFAYILGLIEEIQTMVNKMEAGIEDKNDVRSMLKQRSELNKEIENLKKKKNNLKEGKIK